MAVDLNAHAKPSTVIRDVYKNFQKLDRNALAAHPDLLDPAHGACNPDHHLKLSKIGKLPSEVRRLLLGNLAPSVSEGTAADAFPNEPISIIESRSIPGLIIYPSLFSHDIQTILLERMFHRDLSNPEHKTNVHMHYGVPYPEGSAEYNTASFFDHSASRLTFYPKDPNIHKTISTEQFLNKKLRWMTLGGQYDWTNKVYPSGAPPTFPLDLKGAIEDVFPMKAEAAIVNVYSPGDTLSLHRDVSEECNQPLVSISFGCDGIFVVGLDGEGPDGKPRVEAIRLRSGDAVLMSGESRYAWHGVPKILEGTCPDELQDWPFATKDDACDSDKRFEHWRGWMKGKRINLNVRQMFA